MAALTTERVWSEYQNRIFDFVQNETGDLVVGAVAGSGKSSTLKEIARRLPFGIRANAVFLAFNKHIAEALRKELPSCMHASTIHSEGRRALVNYCKNILPSFKEANWTLDGSKYNKLVKYWYAHEYNAVEATSEWRDEIANAIKLVRLAQLTLANADSAENLQVLAKQFLINFPLDGAVDRVATCVRTVLRRGIIGNPTADDTGRTYAITETYSYDDMVWAPCVLDVTIQTYALLLVDECQDLNNAQRRLVQMMKGKTGRAIWVGDKRQAIYGFAGANSESYQLIKTETGAAELPLSICYRCPTSHIELAQRIVSDIEAAPEAKEGTILEVNPLDLPKYVQANDIILCRCIAPMVTACYDLITAGIPATIKGTDLGSGIAEIVDRITSIAAYRNFKTGGWNNFLNAADQFLTQQTTMLSQKEGTELEIEALIDQCECITRIYKSKFTSLRGPKDLQEAIKALFSDKNAAVTLSTIHKAKGLEAERVGILRYDLIPHPRAATLEQVEQEYNLKYIVLTRSKDTMFFIEDSAARLTDIAAQEPVQADPFDEWERVSAETVQYCRLAQDTLWFYVNGNAYSVKDELKERFGARWDGKEKCWMVCFAHIQAAQSLIDNS